jgi:phosphoglycolate phosphatase-like HAD superfamily hydrolase
MKLFLFDIDGTLVGTGGAGLRALERAVEELHGVSRSCAGLRADGKTDPAIVVEIFECIGRACGDADIAAVLERYLEHLAVEVAATDRYQVMPGVREALDLLDGRGELLGLATGNIERGAEIKLARGDLWRRFGFGGYGSDSLDRARLVARAIERAEARAGRPFDRREVWVIGDTPRDVDAAHRCGAQAAGVATGPYRPDALRAAGAEVVFETLEELPGWSLLR